MLDISEFPNDLLSIDCLKLAKTNPDDASYVAGIKNQNKFYNLTWAEFHHNYGEYKDWVNVKFMEMGWYDGRNMDGEEEFDGQT